MLTVEKVNDHGVYCTLDKILIDYLNWHDLLIILSLYIDIKFLIRSWLNAVDYIFQERNYIR